MSLKTIDQKAVQKVWSKGAFIEGNSKTVNASKEEPKQESSKKATDKKPYKSKSGKKGVTFSKVKKEK